MGVETLTEPSPHLRPWPSDDPYDTFVARHETALWRYLRFLGCPRNLAEDYLQDTFVVAFEREIAGQPPVVAAAWLRTTVRNLMWNDLRKASRRPRRVSMELAELDAEWGKHEHELPDYLSALDACLPLLDARERTVLDQRYRRDWSREQIAAQLGLTVDGVKSLLKRTLQRLRQAVKRKLSENEQ